MQNLRSPRVARIAANVATAALALSSFLQLLLALGILPITMAWGGTQAVLTPALRFASGAAAVLLGIFAFIIRRRAGLIGGAKPPRWTKVAAWLITIFMGVNTLGNFASSSRGETLLFGPISIVILISCLLVSSSKLD